MDPCVILVQEPTSTSLPSVYLHVSSFTQSVVGRRTRQWKYARTMGRQNHSRPIHSRPSHKSVRKISLPLLPSSFKILRLLNPHVAILPGIRICQMGKLLQVGITSVSARTRQKEMAQVRGNPLQVGIITVPITAERNGEIFKDRRVHS